MTRTLVLKSAGAVRLRYPPSWKSGFVLRDPEGRRLKAGGVDSVVGGGVVVRGIRPGPVVLHMLDSTGQAAAKKQFQVEAGRVHDLTFDTKKRTLRGP